MGQLASTTGGARNHSLRTKSCTSVIITLMQRTDKSDDSNYYGFLNYSSNIPDECLACILQSLNSSERKTCSLACHRWLRTEGQSWNCLSLHVQADLTATVPLIFSRFDSVPKLTLKCDYRSNLTDAGVEAFAKNCNGLKKLSCGSCAFGAKAMNAVIDDGRSKISICSNLEILHLVETQECTNIGLKKCC